MDYDEDYFLFFAFVIALFNYAYGTTKAVVSTYVRTATAAVEDNDASATSRVANMMHR